MRRLFLLELDHLGVSGSDQKRQLEDMPDIWRGLLKRGLHAPRRWALGRPLGGCGRKSVRFLAQALIREQSLLSAISDDEMPHR